MDSEPADVDSFRECRDGAFVSGGPETCKYQGTGAVALELDTSLPYPPTSSSYGQLWFINLYRFTTFTPV